MTCEFKIKRRRRKTIERRKHKNPCLECKNLGHYSSHAEWIHMTWPDVIMVYYQLCTGLFPATVHHDWFEIHFSSRRERQDAQIQMSSSTTFYTMTKRFPFLLALFCLMFAWYQNDNISWLPLCYQRSQMIAGAKFCCGIFYQLLWTSLSYTAYLYLIPRMSFEQKCGLIFCKYIFGNKLNVLAGLSLECTGD